jgi:hypothetical protein
MQWESHQIIIIHGWQYNFYRVAKVMNSNQNSNLNRKHMSDNFFLVYSTSFYNIFFKSLFITPIHVFQWKFKLTSPVTIFLHLCTMNLQLHMAKWHDLKKFHSKMCQKYVNHLAPSRSNESSSMGISYRNTSLMCKNVGLSIPLVILSLCFLYDYEM